ncbi:MAG TPA: pitrilysin family protein [Gemmatimonadaceae bacterium]|nr:pitrilysin family protein [Gemmatimonadaceae bacterium]
MTVATRPQPGPPRPYEFPAFERATLGSGAKLLVAEVAKLPIVSVTVVIDAGAESDPPGKEGLAQLTARALVEGTKSSSALALAGRIEKLGGVIDSDAGWDSARLNLTCLSRHLEESLQVMGEILSAPGFPQEELDRLRDERLAEIEQIRSEPRGLAEEAFMELVYAPDARYAIPAGGSRESVGGLTREDVVLHHSRLYSPDNASIVMAGDVSTSRAQSIVERALSGWSGKRGPSTSRSAAPADGGRRTLLVAKEGAAQSELRIGHVGLPRSHPDYFPFSIMNAALGGVFSSRINLNLRERHGYTYGAHSIIDWRKAAGPFVVSTAVGTDVTADAAREILGELERIRAEEITADELSLVVSYLQGVFPIRYESTAAIAGALANLVTYDLPDDYYDTYRDRVGAVTTADALRAAREHVKPESLQMVVVGDAGLRAKIDDMKFGPVDVRTETP